MVADALVYHPAVTHYLRYVATTVGRDKVLRTIQYFSRFYAWYLYRTNNPTSAIQPWTAVKNQFGLTRKILRVGKFVEHIHPEADCYAGYMFFDMMTLLDAMGVKKDPRAKSIQATAYRFWFTGLVASALAGVYNTYKLRERARTVDEKDAEAKVEKVKIARQQHTVNIQLISDLCDLTVPSTILGYVNLDDGIIGLAGVTSSLLGMYGAWQKTA
ncbi:hypothetical protein CLAIMM_13885 [Cladophialophora immunda]|nr:hypothetical protein CLAIMM_13885 [Cladophialophora immunda]